MLLLALAASYWFVEIYIPAQISQKGTEFIPDIKVSTQSAKQATSSAVPFAKKVEHKIMLYDSFFNHATKKGVLHTISFMASENWVLKKNDSKNKNDGHYYTVAGTDNFSMQVYEIPGGIGGGCVGGQDEAPADSIVGTEKVSVQNKAKYIRLIGNLSKSEVSQAYLTGEKSIPCYSLDKGIVLKINNSDNPGINFYLSMSFQKTVSKEQFVNSAEYKAAKELLQSLTVVN